MNTIENNKLIAEFMGYKKSLGITWFKEKAIVTENSFKYHSDWNWLMEVVDGIVNASLPLTFDNKVNKKRVEFFKNITIYSSKDETYNACVEFIKWYNQQQLANS